MQYMWLADEDYRHSDFELLTSKDVYERFIGNIKKFNVIEETCANYNDPEILERHISFSPDNLNKANIDNLLNKWIKRFADMGNKLSYDDVKPFVDNLMFEENRHLIVETSKGFIVFTTYWLDRDKQKKQRFRYQFLPKFEECKEWLENIKKSHS